MARASTPTLLSLDRYAKIMGITPVHFNGAFASPVWPLSAGCPSVWPQYAWQSDGLVSREELALQIAMAEREISAVLGYDLAPTWHEEEEHEWPIQHLWANRANRIYPISIQTDHGQVISPGRRAVTLLDADASVVYSDSDLDGYSETATITIALADPPDLCEVKVYFAGHSADPAFEIRPLRSITTSGGNLIITLDSWVLIEPELLEAYPLDNQYDAVDLTTTASLVTTVDLYREYNDTTQASVRFSWGTGAVLYCTNCNNAGCTLCGVQTQDGCLVVTRAQDGMVVPFSASYDSVSGVWREVVHTVYPSPHSVKLWYYAGHRATHILHPHLCDSLDDYLAQAVAWLATTRLERPLCACHNVQLLSDELHRDLAVSTRDRATLTNLQGHVHTNPFGTRVGEVKAWQRISHLVTQHSYQGGVI